MDHGNEISFAALLAIPIACLVWTFTQEEIFKEAREWLKAYQRRHSDSLWRQKLAYLPTCPYCLSHYVAAGFIALFHFTMLVSDWRGYVVSLFTLVLLTNIYITMYNLLRVVLRGSKAWADRAEAEAAPPTFPPPVEPSRPKSRTRSGLFVET
jgi:hypothetical protein